MNNPDTFENPLVSVVVLSYKSAEFVTETLDSIAAQTWPLLELIIADDASPDNSVEVIKEWIAKNRERFVSHTVISPPKNKGIPANCNRGIREATGDFIKIIAGDDLLLPECIAQNIYFIQNHPEAEIVISDMDAFEDGTSPRKILEHKKPVGYWKPEDSAEKQYGFLLRHGYFGNAPSLFYRKSVFDKVKFDESLRLLEDYPFAMAATEAGIKFWYLPKVTILYRVRDNSVYFQGKTEIFSDFYRTKHEFDLKYRHPKLPLLDRLNDRYVYQLRNKMSESGRNVSTPANKLIYKTLMLTNPYRAVVFIRKKITGSEY